MPTSVDFELLPPDLVPAALRFATVLTGKGYQVEAEVDDVSYPFTPTLVATRGSTTLFVEVASSIDEVKASEWARYGRTCADDTRFSLVVVGSRMPGLRKMRAMTALGVGVEMLNSEVIQQLAPAKDLALRVELPALSQALATVLGRAYELFDQGNWRECFSNACIVLETEATEYLIRAMTMKNLQFVTSSGRAKSYEASAVERMTLGGLATAYSEIAAPNQLEHRVAQALARINGDRITAAHFRDTDPARQRDLRDRVGRHLNTIVNAMRYLTGEA